MSEPVNTVLIIDDEDFIRQSLADFFEDRQWNVLQAESGEQALELLKTESPDVALVDIRLGGMDGNEFILKAGKIKPDMAVIICTGSPEYNIPPEILNIPSVLDHSVKKPVTDMDQLERDLMRLITDIQNKKVSDE
ncbi:MAG: response regulator [Spirochaetes bacterium]|nr:response regulator [Spirochaetota bacterium]